MMLPGKSDDAPMQSKSSEPALNWEEQTLEHRLETTLRQISGAGEVTVLLTERTGSQTLYHTDDTSDESEGSSSLRKTTVITENGDHEESPLITRVDPPVYQGAVIVCQGAGDPRVKLAIVDAVRCATGLGADQITVIKMK